MTMLPRAIELPWQQPRLAVLEISGPIGMQVRAPEMTRTIKALRDDPRVKGVVVEIDSPGGSASVSDAIFRAVRKLSRKKPTIAYVGSGALSGGYLIATGAQRIVSLPTALVGSIGVVFVRPVIKELLDKMGVRVDVTHEGRLKAMMQPWREPTPEEQEKVSAMAAEYYEWFVGTVAEQRGLDPARVREYATGEMFTAQKGREMGLVDDLGDFEQAVEIAREMAGLPAKPRIQQVRPRRPLLERVLARGSTQMARSVIAELESRVYPRVELR
jgi:protease-4